MYIYIYRRAEAGVRVQSGTAGMASSVASLIYPAFRTNIYLMRFILKVRLSKKLQWRSKSAMRK
jgi:hypothetical protein